MHCGFLTNQVRINLLVCTIPRVLSSYFAFERFHIVTNAGHVPIDEFLIAYFRGKPGPMLRYTCQPFDIRRRITHTIEEYSNHNEFVISTAPWL